MPDYRKPAILDSCRASDKGKRRGEQGGMSVGHETVNKMGKMIHRSLAAAKMGLSPFGPYGSGF